jgi:hypothetical protein
MKLLFPLLMSILPAASVAQSQLPSPQPNNFNLPFVLSVIGDVDFPVLMLMSAMAGATRAVLMAGAPPLMVRNLRKHLILLSLAYLRVSIAVANRPIRSGFSSVRHRTRSCRPPYATPRQSSTGHATPD